MQILQNFKHNPKINTIFISKVCVACRVVVRHRTPGLGELWGFLDREFMLVEGT